MAGWQPTASIAHLQKRAELLGAIRQHFVNNAWEADVPCLGQSGVTDLHLDNIPASVNDHPACLQTSPEYFLKRLLATGSGDIYYLGKAFRDAESGQRHNPEFTLLEWYRVGWNEQQLMEEVAALLIQLCTPDTLPVNHFHYGEIFQELTSLNPHQAKLSALQQLAGKVSGNNFNSEPRATCLDLIFSLLVEPQLPKGLTLLDHYPACQAALAKLGKDNTDNTVALRFEAFLDGMELANGYSELNDPTELRQRFNADNALRQTAGKPTRAIDEKFMGALEHGLPECAGVALGVDRLLLYLLNVGNLDAVMPFPFDKT